MSGDSPWQNILSYNKGLLTHASEKEDLVIAAKEELRTKDAKVRLSCKNPSASFRV